jgi:hypothetical protein
MEVAVVVLGVVVLPRRMWSCGPGKRMVPSPMRVKVPFVGNWVSGAAMERVAEVELLLAGR